MQDPAFRTDLAMEAREAAGEIPGVEMTKEQDAGAEIVRVRVRTKEGADALGKPLGTYVTLTHPGLCAGEVRADGALAARLAQEIAALLPLREGAGVLLVREAGGCVTDFEGREPALNRPCCIVAGTPGIHRALLERYL